MLGKITVLQLNRIKKRVQSQRGVPFDYTDAVVQPDRRALPGGGIAAAG